MYCIFLNDRTGKAPVRSVYMVPVLASASTAKQNISCMLHTSCWGIIRSTSARTATLTCWTLRMEAVLDWYLHMWPLLVAVEQGRLLLMNAGVRPGMVESSVLMASARIRVDAGGEQRS